MVCLFDGRGTEATAEITACSKSGVQLQVRGSRTTSERLSTPLILATAVPKGDRFRSLIEKATELEVTRLVPLKTQRSVVHPGTGKLEKLRQTVIAACKQSGRNRLMQIDPVIVWDEFVMREFSGCHVLVAHRGGEPVSSALPATASDQVTVVAIGPEGGFTPEEIVRATAAGGRLLDLGPNVLRIETAAIAMAAACRLIDSIRDA